MGNLKCFVVEPVERSGNGKKEVWRRIDTGELIEAHSYWDLPVGSMFFMSWFEGIEGHVGLDGKSLCVVTPGGAWHVDSRASNCTSPDDNVHKCWCRHGEIPNITVNKEGNTCTAGGGSIQIGEYHGHLINGELTNCPD